MPPAPSVVAQCRAAFAAVEASWRLEPELLEFYRDSLERVLGRLDRRIAACGGWEVARYDDHARAEAQTAEQLLKEARAAYVYRQGALVLAGRSAGGRSRPAPAWHLDAVKRARLLLLQGRRERDIAGILAPSFGMSTDAVRRVLQRAGVIGRKAKKAA